MSQQQINVPDIGDFHDVEVIEILVKPGDTISVDDSIITLESDKASMEIPAEVSGTVVSLNVKLGDRVSQGSPMMVVDVAGSDAAQAPASAPAAKTETPAAAPAASAPAQAAPASAPAASAAASAASSAAAPGSVILPPPPADLEADAFDLVVLGAGPGGYSAAFRAADLGLKVGLIERYPTLGGVCLNVGCIPSKALLHNAAVLEEAKHLGENGISFGTPEINLDQLRAYKNKTVGRLTTGLAGMAKSRKVTVIQGVAEFADPYHFQVKLADGGEQRVAFKQCIIAAGSSAVHLPFLPDDPRIVDSTGALEVPKVPKRMLIIGGGIIGLEMGTVYSSLGARLDVVEMGPGLMAGADRDLVKVWQKKNAWRFDNIMVNTKTVAAEAKKDGIHVTFEGDNAPKEPQVYDFVLQAAGRRPNGKLIGAEKAGVNVDERGFIAVDLQMRTNVPHIYAIGDIIGNPMLAHKAVHEGHVAAEVAAGEKAFFDARVIPGVAFTSPEVAWVGLTEDEAKKQGIAITKGQFPWAASGRAIANGCDEGVSKLIFDKETGRILGGGIVGVGAGDLISEVCLAIEMSCDIVDIGATIHPHPTLGESVGMAAEVAHGSCTDVPPQRKH